MGKTTEQVLPPLAKTDLITGGLAMLRERLLEVRDVPRIAERFKHTHDERLPSIGMVISRYLTKFTRDRLAEVGLSYVDATGNLLLRADIPTVFISDRGADRDP